MNTTESGFWIGVVTAACVGLIASLAFNEPLKVTQQDIKQAELLCNTPALQIGKYKSGIRRVVVLSVNCDKLGELEVTLERPGTIN